MSTGSSVGPIDIHSTALRRRRTKIVATIGPASATPERLAALIDAGVNVFRLNFSHGTHDSHADAYAAIRDAAKKARQHVAVLADLCGPKIRCGHFRDGGIDLVEGERVVVTVRKVEGERGLIPSEYDALAGDVKAGDRILMDDGQRELRVEYVELDTDIVCTVLRGGRLTDRKGINLPGVEVSAPSLTDKDRSDATFAAHLGVDFMALSFVRRSADVQALRSLLGELGAPVPIIAKIEKPEALQHIGGILEVADGIMVARGDLGVEMPAEEVPLIQRELTRMAIERNRVVIVATQMLESMIQNARPTRAEVTDVAWAAMAGADAVMLSGETAVGRYPIDAVATMDRVLRLVEGNQWEITKFGGLVEHVTPASEEATTALQLSEGLARAVANLSRELSVHAIVVRSHTGHTARMIAAERPSAPIVAIAANEQTCRRLALSWGVIPRVVSSETLEHPVSQAPLVVKGLQLADTGAFILVVTGGGSEEERSAPSIKMLLT